MKRVLLVLLALAFFGALAFASGKSESASSTTGPKQLTVWEQLWYNTAVSVPNLADTPLYKELEKRTGVHVTFIHPPQGQQTQAFNLLIASNQFPDIIADPAGNGWLGYPGGPEKAISDGVIIKLNDIMAKDAPNLMGILKDHPDWMKAAKTDNGTLYEFPFIRGHQDLLVFFGPQLRKDWLDKLGLKVPVTLDDWTNVLTAFQKAGLSKHPLAFTNFTDGRGVNGPGYSFIQPFGITWDFYQDDNGKVHFGPYENAFKDFLTFFKGWYDKGLIDPEFISTDRKTFDAKILNGDVGAWTSYTGSGIGAYLDANNGKGTFNIVPAPNPVLKAGDTPFYGQRDNWLPGFGYAISSQAKDPDLAAKWIDYGYSKEGNLLFNFGIEGVSYHWVTNYPGFEGQKFPEYTPLMTANPDGKTLAEMGGLYTRSFYSGPIVQDREYIYQYAHRPQQRSAIQIWGQTDAAKHELPNISATPQEADQLASIMSEVNTYREEMFVKFITGQEPLSNFAAFQARLKQMGIEKAIQIEQAGLDRYNAR